ncbi:GntR family transcriptional regulator [Alkalibacillus silvisoli]|uniref:GntR family transcriptional regulator n=1 Tax=Alkalibacillus silvisoli TaxID=392823 RepID=A0ABN1AB47_9BACI
MFNSISDGSEQFGMSLPQQISRFILEKIIRGELTAGDKIVEEEIAKELNTSRAPVREALYLLQVKGIVDRVPRRGTIVKPFTDKDILDYLFVMVGIIQQGVDLSKDSWTKENQGEFHGLFVKAKQKYNEKDVIEYQNHTEKLFRFIIYMPNNKALIKFYEEANQILNIFAQVQWDIKTMENFHPKFIEFATAILESNFVQAKEAISEALKKGKG